MSFTLDFSEYFFMPNFKIDIFGEQCVSETEEIGLYYWESGKMWCLAFIDYLKQLNVYHL